MNDYSRNRVFTEENKSNESVSSVCSTECLDPLENLGVDIVPKIYRLNSVVFAEPLKITKAAKDDLAQDSIFEDVDTIDIENVTIIKRKGKRNKYNINIKQSDLICPQQQCKKSFPTTTLLKAHIRKVHCSEKDFVCEQCGTGFTAQYLLNRHYLIHSKEKIQCPVCCKMLSRRTNLRVHLRSHADTRPHECLVCHKRFLRRSTMNVHVSFVHKNHDRSPDVNPEKGDTRCENAISPQKDRHGLWNGNSETNSTYTEALLETNIDKRKENLPGNIKTLSNSTQNNDEAQNDSDEIYLDLDIPVKLTDTFNIPESNYRRRRSYEDQTSL